MLLQLKEGVAEFVDGLVRIGYGLSAVLGGQVAKDRRQYVHVGARR